MSSGDCAPRVGRSRRQAGPSYWNPSFGLLRDQHQNRVREFEAAGNIVRTAWSKTGTIVAYATFHHVASLDVDRISWSLARISHPDVEIVPVVVKMFRHRAQPQIPDQGMKIGDAQRAGMRRVAH